MALAATSFNLPGQIDLHRGNAYDVYSLDNNQTISVATDRVSAFGGILEQPIPHKGVILNQISLFFLDATKDIVPNWCIKSPHPNVIIGRQCKSFAVDIVIRGCLAGHAWRVYQAGVRELSGVALPDGMQLYDSFEEPIITPSTRALASHNVDMSAMDIVEHGLASEEQFERLSIIARQLFIRGRQMARQRGLLLADTRYKFGICDGEIHIVDELHTPDSSRYFDVNEYDTYIADRNQPLPKHLSKEFIREWLLDHGYSGLEDQVRPRLDDTLITEIQQIYIKLYERLLARPFIYQETHGVDEEEVIKQSILGCIQQDQRVKKHD